jgi:sugar phosphate isomerase/epimerase
MKRRTFLQTAGVLSAITALGIPRHARAHDAAARVDTARKKLLRIGLELYAVRKAMRADPERTLAAVRRAGYLDVELLWSFQNFGRSTAQVRDSLAAEGLKAPSAHISPTTLTADWDASLETAKQLGHSSLIVPDLPAADEATLDGWRRWADRFNTAGAKARTAGLWLAFHNEPNHMKPIDGQVPFDLFVSLLDPAAVRLQFDTGNLTMGGGDAMEYLRRYLDRYHSFHIKDVVADRSRDTELGKGVVNIAALLALVPALNDKPVYVEQEAPADELSSAQQNAAYLAKLEF